MKIHSHDEKKDVRESRSPDQSHYLTCIISKGKHIELPPTDRLSDTTEEGSPRKNDTGIPTLHSMVTISTQLEHAVQLETILRASQTLYGVYSHYYGTETHTQWTGGITHRTDPGKYLEPRKKKKKTPKVTVTQWKWQNESVEHLAGLAEFVTPWYIWQ